MPYIKFQNGVETLKALVNIEINFAVTTILNSREDCDKLTFNKPLNIELLNLSQVNFVEEWK